MTNRAKCKAKRSDGKPCGSFAVEGGGGKCFTHTTDPKLVAARATARSAGGQRRAQQQQADREDVLRNGWAALDTVEDCELALTHLVGEVLAGRMGAKEAQAATTGIKILMEQAEAADRHGFTPDDDEAAAESAEEKR